MAEEKARAEATWQEWDFKMALAAFGSVEDLRPYVANPEDFVKAREHLVLRMSDQIPIWIMLQASRQLYGEGELRKLGQKNKEVMKQMTGQTHESQVLHGPAGNASQKKRAGSPERSGRCVLHDAGRARL